MQFAQLLEQLLSIQSRDEQWVRHGYVIPQSSFQGSQESYNPGLGGLVIGWCRKHQIQASDVRAQQLDEIRKLRNDLMHEGRAITCSDLRSRLKWNEDAIVVEMEKTLSLISGKQWELIDQLLLKSLYEWGLGQLN
jgi:hypothetical protein